jgi:phosphate/sulfate permease
MKGQLNALAIYQIVGGIIGIGLTVLLAVGSSFVQLLLIPLFVVAFGLFSYSIFCGFLLYKNVNKGLSCSKINQILQAVQFAGLGYAYKYISGLGISVGMEISDSFKFNANLTFSAWQLAFNTGDSDRIVSINLLALFLIIWIDRTKAAMEKERVNSQLDEFGQGPTNEHYR